MKVILREVLRLSEWNIDIHLERDVNSGEDFVNLTLWKPNYTYQHKLSLKREDIEELYKTVEEMASKMDIIEKVL